VPAVFLAGRTATVTTAEVAQDHYRDRQAIAAAVAAEAAEAWRELNPGDLDAWDLPAAQLAVVLTGAQQQAASAADDYVDTALSEQGAEPSPAGRVDPRRFAGVASDGRPLEGLLRSPVVATKLALARGTTVPRALATGQATLDMMVRTQVADAGRAADGVAVAARPSTGYVRMLQGKSCSRCAILAGRYYRWSAGFWRHPRCDCIHVPARGEQAARSEGLVSDPKEFFNSLSPAEQAQLFTKAGAQAIRDGADMNQVVNARRGAAGLSKPGGRLTREEQRMLRGGRDRGELARTDVFGQQVFTTTEGTTTRGLAGQRMREQGARTTRESGETVTRRARGGDVQRTVNRRRVQAPRLMPESIYELADSRDDAIRLLKRFGYII
ncbi:VG15 protein, partial [Prauserella sediminis]|uniref:VG15 protein n=1 Tax=Prauserella sediminis TaxID=577680 RepID=UPI001C84DC8B